jgi:hypothetical protein
MPLLVFAVSLLLAALTFDPKLSLSGDNAEFITLARSLIQGKGLTYINSPHPQTATKYPFGFPLLLAPLEWLFPGKWVPMKWLVVLLFALAMAIFSWMVRERLGPLPALAVTLLCLMVGNSSHSGGPPLLDYAHQVMSEVPYLAFSLLALLLLDRGARVPGIAGNYWLISGFLCSMWACYLRSAGLILVAVFVIYLLVQHDWRRAMAFGGAAFLFWLPWSLRNLAAGGGGIYFKQLFMVNPYYPDQGLVALSGLQERLVHNISVYLTHILPATLSPWPGSASSLSSPIPLTLAGMAVYTTAVSLRRRRDLLLFIYTAFYLGMVLLWPWQGDRFLVPIVPLLFFFAVRIALDAIAAAQKFGAGMAAVLFSWVLCAALLIGSLEGLGKLRDFSRSEYPSHLKAWENYKRAGEWLMRNTPEGSVVLCRKGFWMYIVSGRPCIVFPFAEPDSIIAYMEREEVDFVVLESLGFRQTALFLVPAINLHKERFQILWQRDNPPTYVLRFARDS